MTDLGRPWTRDSVHGVLTNEKYIGNNVWNCHSTRLKAKRTNNSPEQWVRAENAFEPIIDRKLFDQAQVILKKLYRHQTNEEMLIALRKILARRGDLSAAIIDSTPGCPPSARYHARFGSIVKAYELIGYRAPKNYRFIHVNWRLEEARLQEIDDLLTEIEKGGGLAIHDRKTDLIRVNDEFTVAMTIGRCRASRFGYPRWFSKADRLRPDIFVLIRMNPGNFTVRDYLIAPAHELAGKQELHAHNGARLDSFVFPSLAPLVALAQRAAIGSAPCQEV
jgi:hypothetical protein